MSVPANPPVGEKLTGYATTSDRSYTTPNVGGFCANALAQITPSTAPTAPTHDRRRPRAASSVWLDPRAISQRAVRALPRLDIAHPVVSDMKVYISQASGRGGTPVHVGGCEIG